MLLDSLGIFCARSDSYKHEFERYLNSEELSDNERNSVLESLCGFLMEPTCTRDVAECFPQYLLLLLSRAIRTDFSQSLFANESNRLHRLNCAVLGTLIPINPDVLGFALRYFESNPAPFGSSVDNSATMTKRRRENDVPFVARDVTTMEIVTASYNILEAAPEHFKHKWNWSEFYGFLLDEDDAVKWIALRCIGTILGMSEFTRLTCARSLIENHESFLLVSGTVTPASAFISTKDPIDEINVASKSSSQLVSVAGVLLPIIHNDEPRKTTNLIPVPSMLTNLRGLALAVASRSCVCLQGSVGCGKTALVEYLASVTGHENSNFIKVQLGDQTDSKMLLGTYRCTDIPGEFVWQPGVLTQAATMGKWLLLEDIDSAAHDVASCLSNLMETGTLSVPGYRDTIYPKSGFQLFLTRRLVTTATGLHSSSSVATNILEKHWFTVNVESLNRDELVNIVKTLFPPLTTIATRIIDVFLLFSMGNHAAAAGSKIENFTKTGRSTSTRDLIKWCTRAIIDFKISSPDSALKIFQDAIDIFCSSVDDRAARLELAASIGHSLGIVRTKAEYFCNTHKASIVRNTEFFRAGRAKLRIKRSEHARMEITRKKFSFTRPSANLLERVASCVAHGEPALLVGETGTGKTSSIQYLAESTGNRLIVINMNQQSESADLLGGYKPVDFKYLITPTRQEFEILFRSYFAIEPNKKFLEHVALAYKQQKWKILVDLMRHSASAAVKRQTTKLDGKISSATSDSSAVEKKSRQDHEIDDRRRRATLLRWERLVVKLEKLRSQVRTNFSLAFAFIEGSLIEALHEGHWILLDEINLASSETLECLSGLLEGSTGTISLLERGDSETIKRHPSFAIFACMNPATDIGKKELPIGLRNRFTEFHVDELAEKLDLQLLVNSYLGDVISTTEQQESIVKFYLNVRREATCSLNDGTGHRPHYSLRTLCRALSVASTNPCGNIQRSLYESFCLSFLTQLDHRSYATVKKMIARALLDPKNSKAILGSPIPKPSSRANSEDYINFEGYWLVSGKNQPSVSSNYILTSSVRRNLRDLVRIVSIGKIPVLLQGDTSVGKTSLITYLARSSGNICKRINNHEHTDLQEYVGSYVADESGKLIFKEGILVEAMRHGHWIILDELNLAPSDVLEALNRVLDDNRELFIPETRIIVKAHENFMLFATQNPPGLYGGRKVLSRAFRNRFVELHFDEIPSDELETIMHERCQMPISYCKQIINVMSELQTRRKSTATFQGKHGFITLRDLFRWGERYRLATNIGEDLYDWSQHLADEGYLVLAAKVRKNEEAQEIRRVIEKHLRRDVDPASLFNLNEKTSRVTRSILEEINGGVGIETFDHVVWTYHMRRMAVLVRKSCQFDEPVLLVGETGCGKTTICQLIAAMSKRNLYTVNCHMHTESSDFLGNLRPVREHGDTARQKLFEWVDGPLIEAMTNGDLFLADEISLADDSVLERLNSLLEPERSLLLAEKSVDSADSGESDCTITAHEKFHFIGTMNPGGDYGKKELSPALRNRFTEIWCEGCVEKCDLQTIIQHNLNSRVAREKREIIADAMLSFVDWLKESEIGKRFIVSIRDILTWVNFINSCIGENEASRLCLAEAYLHGACLTYIDSLGSGLTGMESAEKLEIFRSGALSYLKAQAIDSLSEPIFVENHLRDDEKMDESSRNVFGIAPFFIARGSNGSDDDQNFTFSAPTTKSNTLKLLRALQLKKPLLLEGSPGVGKTSLVSALARASGHTLLRINLSDQTDISDLFGADLPVEGGKGGQFAWRDGPFLRALRAGDWILLDELNLASQSVLEGLNACLDHRGEIYVPELGRTFSVTPATKLFGCQNPLRQGGARRGLPKSFLNRFTQVYVDALNDDDLRLIARDQFPAIPLSLLEKIVSFNSRISREAGTVWGHSGSPWEMNLRDITRWCEIIVAGAASRENFANDEASLNPGDGIEAIYVDRMRTRDDRRRVREIYEDIFDIERYPMTPRRPIVHLTETILCLGDVRLSREDYFTIDRHGLLLLRDQYAVLRSLGRCVRMNWMPILVGGPGCGKSSVVRVLAQLTGQRLRSVVVNSAMDTTEILGGFEQTDYNRHLEQLLEQVESLLIEYLKLRLNDDGLKEIVEYQSWLERVQNLSDDENHTITMTAETELFLRRTKELWRLVKAMKSLDHPIFAELPMIDEKLQKLANNVKQDKCLNAGGKFEWIDSILVKCLQEGSWLLLDQVNLCSPAVLDRLNGLLEPGGVLTIGERGVANDGNVLTIKPHKNFRLFLTMDPRHGEISRAMRNRGVEIYMLGNKENWKNDIIDVRSMLENLGLVNSNRQEALLEIHEKISSEDSSLEKLSLVHLLSSAFLINQQISRGFPAHEAFRISCCDVYAKSRLIRETASLERRKIMIDDIIVKHDVTNGGENFFDLSAATPKIRHLVDNSKLTIVRQQAFLLDSALRIFSTNKEKRSIEESTMFSFANEFLGITRIIEADEDFRIVKIMPHLLLNFYENSSLSDAQLRKRWFDEISRRKNDETGRKLCETSDTLADEIEKTRREFDSEVLPWDSMNLPNFGKYEKSPNGANRLALILYLIAMDIRYEGILDDMSLDKNDKVISLLQYSSSVYHGKLTSHLKDQPLITNFVIFIAQLNSCVDLILRDSSIVLSSEDYAKLRINFSWLARFYSLGNVTLIDKTPKTSNNCVNPDETNLMLRVHYKWLVKYLIGKLLELGEKFHPCDERRMEFTRLTAMMDNIERSVRTIDDPLRKIAKSLRKYLPVPLPFTSEIVATIFSKLKKFSRDLAPCTAEFEDSTLKRELKLILLQSNETMRIRHELMNIWNFFYNDRCYDETIVENLREIEDSCDRWNLRLRTPIETSRALAQVQACREREIDDLTANVRLWPIYEYIFFLVASNLHRRIHENRRIEDSTLEILSKVPSIPIDLVALLRALVRPEIGANERDRLKNEIFPLLDRFVGDSRAFRDSKCILHSRRLAELEMEESSTSSRDASIENPIDSPILASLVSEFLINEKRETIHEKSILARARLGTYRTTLRQLRTLNEILWRNSVAINSPDYDEARNDRSILEACLKVFLTAVEKMSAEIDTEVIVRKEIAKQTGNGSRELEEKFKRDYVEPIEELKRKSRDFAAASRVIGENNERAERARTWMILGYLQAFLFANLGAIDPIRKIGLKLRYARENIDDCKKAIYVADLDSRIRGVSSTGPDAPCRTIEMTRSLERLENERKNLETCKAVRPFGAKFIELAREASHFRASLVSWPIVEKIMKKLTNTWDNIGSAESSRFDDPSVANDAIREAEIWRESLKRFGQQFEKKFFTDYPDMVAPLLQAVAQLRHGAKSLSDETARSLKLRGSGDNEKIMENLVRFPTIGNGQNDLLSLVRMSTCPRTREMINKNIRNEMSDPLVSLVEQFRMIRAGLSELYNHISLEGKLDAELWRELDALLQQIVLIWQRQRDENEKRASEMESLYKSGVKIQGDRPNDDEDIARELSKLFPTSRDEDFTDIEAAGTATLEQTDGRRNAMENERQCESYAGLINDQDISEVHRVHSRIVNFFVKAPWMRKRIDANARDYVRPLIQRYKTFGLIRENLMPAMNRRSSARIYGSLNLLTSWTISASTGHSEDPSDRMTVNGSAEDEKSYDYYRSSNVNEVKQCLPILESIVDRVDDFLKEWPEHPTLGAIGTIIRRINGFSISSPISRFLTGLELLLAKMREWEENAHSGVSLAELSLALIQQIISWRRLELACWKNCLDSARERLRSRASKWWFFLYALVESYVTSSSLKLDASTTDECLEAVRSDEPVSAKKLIELLEAFVAGSSLVEFQPRLDLLLTFHSHAYHLRETTERDQLLAILWNVYNYYMQFSSEVNKRMESLKAPIERKLRDFVKIARWNDINYWSVRETVEKTHRTLHKFIREYEAGLGASVATCLLIKSTNWSTNADKGEWDRSGERDYSIDPRDFVYSGKLTSLPVAANETTKNSLEAKELVSRMESLLIRAKRFCRETIIMSSYPGLRVRLEEFMENMIARAGHLRSMDIDRTVPRSKQKSHAKSILQQKRMALADYFRTLSRIGLSYRTGRLAWKNRQSRIIDLTVPPVDLAACLERFEHGKIDKQTLAQWKGCENYYYKSLIQLNALNIASMKIQSDLGMPNMERCSGYSSHIMLMAHKQKRLIAGSFDAYVSLRKQITSLSMIIDCTAKSSGNREWHDCAESLKNLIVALRAGLEQLKLYLQACPADPGLDAGTEILTLETSKTAIVNATRNDPIWESANSLLQRCLASLIPIVESHDNLSYLEALIITPAHWEFLNESYEILQNVKLHIREFARAFTSETERSHPILESIEFLESRLNEWTEKFLLVGASESVLVETDTRSDDERNEYASGIELLVKTVLLVIQQKYKETRLDNALAVPEVGEDEKSAVGTNEEKKDTEKEEEEANDEDDMGENSFRDKLIGSLEKDVNGLRLNEINECLVSLLKMTNSDNAALACERRALIVRCLPLLRQYLLFSQFYLNEQIGAFRATCKLLNLQLSVFLDLATNGFCVPKDLDVEAGDGEDAKEGKTQNGMGLGDGEGDKDVSERIESEDQLDEARPAERERENENDEDCKEEENGIDMSEDFDAKMQDIERNEDDENGDKSADENEDDLDKQMGDTEQGADALDEEIWADDKDESSNENDEDMDEENRGKGEEIGEKEMTARDESKKSNEENERNEDGDRKKEEEEKQDINEINEPEINDDQIDPYHGNQVPPPEPEPMDLPDDINLDGEDADDKPQGDEENPFDIDEMKDCMPPMEKEEAENEEERKKDQEPGEDSSDEEEAAESGDAKATNEESPENEEPEPEASSDSKTQLPEKRTDEDEPQEEKKSEEIDADEPEDAATASHDDPSKELDASDQPPEANKDGSRDKTADQLKIEEQQESTAENNEDESNNRGTGNAQSEQQETGHTGSSMENTASVRRRDSEKQQIEKRKNPGESDENRSLVDKIQPDRKKMRMINARDETIEAGEEEGAEINEDERDTEMCQHVRNTEKYDDQAVDAATKEQVKRQATNNEDEEEKSETAQESMDIEMNDDDENEDRANDADRPIEQCPEVVADAEKNKDGTRKDTRGRADDGTMERVVEIEGDLRETARVDRGAESAFFTNINDTSAAELSSAEVSSKRLEVETMLSQWANVPTSDEALVAWNCLNSVVEAPARELAEKLRLVLEPTQATRLKGDYRTGRRINMRKIIPYIASQFRKDKIWMRRTKPSKRDYQIVLALDDSSSMADNHSKELAFESLSLISKAMGYLEVGELSVLSFGETTNVLHPLGQPFAETSGSRLIQEMRFDQKKTKVGQLVDFTVDMFESQKSSTDSAKLLVVLSDGRGVFSEGLDNVNSAVRRARLADIFLVFIIVDNPLNKDSILDIRMPVFQAGKLLGIKSYMDSFPFPFYMILRDINALPDVLSDALRQWFEVVGKIDT